MCSSVKTFEICHHGQRQLIPGLDHFGCSFSLVLSHAVGALLACAAIADSSLRFCGVPSPVACLRGHQGRVLVTWTVTMTTLQVSLEKSRAFLQVASIVSTEDLIWVPHECAQRKEETWKFSSFVLFFCWKDFRTHPEWHLPDHGAARKVTSSSSLPPRSKDLGVSKYLRYSEHLKRMQHY